MTIRCSVFIATSFDGYIAREDGGLDWLPANPEPHGYDEFIASVDAIVIGRKTFETVLGFGGWAYGRKQVFVLSSNPTALRAPDGAVCEFLSGEPGDVVGGLEKRGFNHLYIDGGVTIQRFLEADLIDDIVLTRIPVLLGSGIPLFGHLSHDVVLDHVATRTYKGGLVQGEYVVRHKTT